MLVASGGLINVSVEDMRLRGLTITSDALEDFGACLLTCPLQRMTARERSRFHAAHQTVAVCKVSDSLLEFQGFEEQHGAGGVGTSTRRIAFQLPATQKAFLAALTQTFQMTE